MTNEELIKELKETAEFMCIYDNYDEGAYINIEEKCRRNFDDAFEEGEHAGKVMFARKLLGMMGIQYNE